MFGQFVWFGWFVVGCEVGWGGVEQVVVGGDLVGEDVGIWWWFEMDVDIQCVFGQIEGVI